VIGGQVRVTFANLLAVLPHVQAGKLRALGITSATRSGAAPSLRTIAESGLKAYDFTSWFGMLTPTGTPKDVVQKLNDGIVSVLKSPKLKERLTRDGADIVASTLQGFGAYMKSETAKWNKVIKEENIRAD
jgi:tripartite-type tricarboxylate transporter receptor subunit TctC